MRGALFAVIRSAIFNHLYRIYGILVCIHALDRNQIHKHESKIIYEKNKASCFPQQGKCMFIVLKASNSRELEFGGPYRDRADYLPVMSGTLIPLKLKALLSAMPDLNWRP